MPLKK